MQIVQTGTFTAGLTGLADVQATARIVVRIRRLELGNAGDAKSVGEGVSEMRIEYGPGYRVYFTKRGRSVVLLCGGDKKSQRKEIAAAQKMAKEI